MNLAIHPEPELEFGRGRHICPKAGITEFDVFDSRFSARRDQILVGGIGTSDGLEDLEAWLERCSRPIIAHPGSRQPNLFSAFCGFNELAGFRARFRFEAELQRRMLRSDVRSILKIEDHDERVSEAVEVYYSHARFLAQNRNLDVLICVLPNDLYDLISRRQPNPVEEEPENREPDDLIEMNFRRALKAKCLHLGVPLQLVRAKSLEASPKGMQDDATRAWNFCTALYYKANKTVPWRLPLKPNRPSVCFAGIGFFRSRDRKVLHTSLAQIFDELGNGVILRGTPVEEDKDDRRPFLKPDQAEQLLGRALAEYRNALEHSPARLVLHRSSGFREDELEGFKSALAKESVSVVDFVSISETDLRVFRDGLYPPIRGTRVEISDSTHLLYTKGSVPFYGTYPGMYIPHPLRVTVQEAEESPAALCEEILALSKMNWNVTQFDGKYPITLHCARRVGDVLKYAEPEERPPISYSFYM